MSRGCPSYASGSLRKVRRPEPFQSPPWRAELFLAHRQHLGRELVQLDLVIVAVDLVPPSTAASADLRPSCRTGRRGAADGPLDGHRLGALRPRPKGSR